MDYPVSESAECPSLAYSSSGAARVLLDECGSIDGWRFAHKCDGSKVPPLRTVLTTIIRNVPHVTTKPTTIVSSQKATIRRSVSWIRRECPQLDIPQDILNQELHQSLVSANANYENIETVGNSLYLGTSKVRNKSAKDTAFYITDSNPSAIQICEIARDGSTFHPIPQSAPSDIGLASPIFQLYGSKINLSKDRPPFLAARTQFNTSIILPHFSTNESGNTWSLLDTIGEIGDDFGDYEHHDLAFNDYGGGKEAALINSRGEVLIWTCSSDENGGRRTYYTSSLQEWNIDALNRMDVDDIRPQARWQVNFTSKDTLLIKSCSDLSLLDIRSPQLAKRFHYAQDASLALSKSQIWSVVAATERDFFISTSDHICWIDHRYATRPALSWKHFQRRNPSLALESISLNSDAFELLLWSRARSLLCSFSFDRSGNPPTYSSGMDPYSIHIGYGSLSGLSFSVNESGGDLFTCTTDGRLSHQRLERSSAVAQSPVRSPSPLGFAAVNDQIPPMKEYREIDLSILYERATTEQESEKNALLIPIPDSLSHAIGFPFDDGPMPKDLTERLHAIYSNIPVSSLQGLATQLASVESISMQNDGNAKVNGYSSVLDSSDAEITLNLAARSLRDLWNTDTRPESDIIDFATLLGHEEGTPPPPSKRTKALETMPMSDPAPFYVPEIGTSREPDIADIDAASQPVAGLHAMRSRPKTKRKSTRTAGF